VNLKIRKFAPMSQPPVTIRLAGRDAQVEIDGRRFTVEASTKDGRRNGCPGELIVAALGS
jgi:hypothetical protein